MAKVPGRSVGAALEFAAADDACADAGGHLDEKEVVVFGPVRRAFAERHDVDVVVHQHGDRQRAPDVTHHVEPVPAGHDGRLNRHAGGMLHRAGQPDPDAGEVRGCPACLTEECFSFLDHTAQYRFRTDGNVLGQAPFGKDVAA
ncbi:hypothetical protein D9M72_454210 [compost metagenome]